MARVAVVEDDTEIRDLYLIKPVETNKLIGHVRDAIDEREAVNQST